MMAKSLITLLLLFNPFVFFAERPKDVPLHLDNDEKVVDMLAMEGSEDQNSAGTQKSWEKWNGFLSSALQSANPNFLPIRDWSITDPEIDANAAVIATGSRVKPFANGASGLSGNNILYQKNMDVVAPIASLTKLMTAIITLEHMKLDDVVVVSEEALERGYGEKGKLAADELISVEALLYALLVESSNDAAFALAEHYEKHRSEGEKTFVALMNDRALRLGLAETYFVDPSGFAPENVSTAQEIIRLAEYSFNYPLIWDIMKTPEISVSSIDGSTRHFWTNTDELLNRLPYIIGGKTGYTSVAGGCLVLAIERRPQEDSLWCELFRKQSEYLITVVLGAESRFLQTEKLIRWAERAYKW